ncbi:hypothetical protein QZH41_007609 [Actinostola sp. cb2023]|nr:hypothetical protein QZH41_007609 [Actinostola sp. cb2023]
MFTLRRILYELRVPLPGDPEFSRDWNPFHIYAKKRLCREFGIPVDSDFRFLGGSNGGIGDVWINIRRGIIRAKDFNEYAFPSAWPSGFYKFDDEGCSASRGNCIHHVTEPRTKHQYDWFVPQEQELTQAGLGRINRSIESFVYCAFSSQVSTRTAIVGGGRGSVNTQLLFVKRFEETLTNDIAASVRQFQKAIFDSRVRLDNAALSPGLWMIPSKLVINNDLKFGYNNSLQRATDEMIFGSVIR